jgi:hypothetical protein
MTGMMIMPKDKDEPTKEQYEQLIALLEESISRDGQILE